MINMEDKYKFIVDAYREMMTLINRDYVYELVNDFYCQTFGKSREEFIGKKISDVWGEKRFNSEIKAKIDQCLNGDIYTEEDYFIIPGGQKKYYVLSYFPYRNSNNEITHVIGVTKDITERKEAELALQKSEKTLRSLNEQKDKFLAIVNSDLDNASNYVNSLLPPRIDTPGLKIDWKIVPSAKLGGDSFGYHWIDEDHLGLYMFDVTGHGVGAALHCVSALNILRFETLVDTDFRKPDEVLSGLNQLFQMSDHYSLFITMWYAVYKKSAGILTYAGAGHPPLIIFNQKGTIRKIASENVVIGVKEDVDFRSGSYAIEGDTVVYIYTDGAYEAELPDGKMLKIDDLVNFLSKHRNQSVDEIELLYQTLVDLNEGKSLGDDFTIMRIKFIRDKKNDQS
jgi:sigma-B regulation protein RsbU (phosphoserine phosphatase)